MKMMSLVNYKRLEIMWMFCLWKKEIDYKMNDYELDELKWSPWWNDFMFWYKKEWNHALTLS